jgi:hypothetical protein
VNARRPLTVNQPPHFVFEAPLSACQPGTQRAVVPAMISENLLNRARYRCGQYRDINAFCPCCLEFVLAETLVEENPDLCMDDAIELVSEWIMCREPGEYRFLGLQEPALLTDGRLLSAAVATPGRSELVLDSGHQADVVTILISACVQHV